MAPRSESQPGEGAADGMTITVCFAPSPRVVHTSVVQLPAHAQLRDALALCVANPLLASAVQAVAAGKLYCSVWGTKATPDQPLQPHDRIELCRPLRVDPKVARRERFAQQGARTSGLFAQRRPGAKPGY
jgi:uncharacterized protein